MEELVVADPITEAIEPVRRLRRDVRLVLSGLGVDEARYLVDLYYAIQDNRKAANNQGRALTESEEPHEVITWFGGNMELLEENIKRVLGHFSDSDPVGRWAKSIVGIGPVIAAGLIAHIDIEKAPTAGHIWRFAGLDPTVKWEKGKKRPWNAGLKTLTWKIGQSFMKFQNNPRDTYGQYYVARKALEQQRNESGLFADQAAYKLANYKIGKDTEAYKWYSQGKLPPAHIDARARRWVVKLFLSGYQEAAYFARYNALAPRPYILTRPDHAHYYAPPNVDLIPGWGEMRAKAGL